MKHTLSLLSVIFAAGATLSAQIWYVSPKGSDWMDGGPDSPFRTINYAMSQAQNGDTIRLRQGTYREHVCFRENLSITLEGPKTAVIDASDFKYQPKWSRAKDMPDGTWETPVRQEYRTVTVDGKLLTMLDYRRVTPEAAARRPAKVQGDAVRQEIDGEIVNIWDYNVIFQRGIGQYGWPGILRIGMYHPEKQVIYFRDEKNAEPGDLKVTFSRADQPAIQLRNADDCIIRGITIRNAFIGIDAERTKRTVVEDCVFQLCEFGVRLGKDCSSCKVRRNEFSLPACSVTDPAAKESADTRKAHQEGGFPDRDAIRLEGTSRHEIGDNKITGYGN